MTPSEPLENLPMPRRVLLASTWTALLLVLVWTPNRVIHESYSFNTGHWDNVVHFGLFFGFGILWIRALRSPHRAAWVLGLGLLFAIVTELVQGLPLIERDPNTLDALNDILGVIVGIGVYRLLGSSIESAAPASEPW